MTDGSTGINSSKCPDYNTDVNVDSSSSVDCSNNTNGADGPVLVIQRQDLDAPPLYIKLPSIKDLPPPNQMTPEMMVVYLEQLSSQLMRLGCALSKTQIEHHQKQRDIDTKEAQNKIEENADKLKELKHKEKVAKSWKIGIFVGSMVLTLATAGTAGGLVAVAAGAAFVVTGVSGGLELSGALEKYAEDHPDEAKAIQITLLVVQCALCLFSIGAAWRAAATAGPEVAAMAADDGAAAAAAGGKGAATAAGGAEGAATTTEIAAGETATATEGAAAESLTATTEQTTASAANSASKSATKAAEGSIDDVADDAAEEGKTASDAANSSKGAKGKDAAGEAGAVEGVKDVSAEGIAGADDGVEDLSEMALRIKKMARLIKKIAALVQGLANIGAGAVEIQAGQIKKDVGYIQADMVELKAATKMQREMIQQWLKNIEDITGDFNKTIEGTTTMYQARRKAGIAGVKGAVVNSPTQSGTV